MTLKEQLRAALEENARLKEKMAKPRALTLKVSEKGAASLYGLGRFPVTLYKEQWAKVLDFAPEIQAFIESNPGLKVKEV